MPYMTMKKYLLATALVGLGSAPTIAADLAARTDTALYDSVYGLEPLSGHTNSVRGFRRQTVATVH